jgi:hypothetical protein
MPAYSISARSIPIARAGGHGTEASSAQHEPDEVIRSAYFMNSGMASVLTVQPDGRSVEVGLVGKEGFVGLPVIFGFKTSALRLVTQLLRHHSAAGKRIGRERYHSKSVRRVVKDNVQK